MSLELGGDGEEGGGSHAEEGNGYEGGGFGEGCSFEVREG